MKLPCFSNNIREGLAASLSLDCRVLSSQQYQFDCHVRPFLVQVYLYH